MKKRNSSKAYGKRITSGLRLYNMKLRLKTIEMLTNEFDNTIEYDNTIEFLNSSVCIVKEMFKFFDMKEYDVKFIHEKESVYFIDFSNDDRWSIDKKWIYKPFKMEYNDIDDMIQEAIDCL